MDDLVQRLSTGDHPVTVGGPKPSLEEFKKRVEDMGYVFIKFTGTRGGTDLGVRVDKNTTDLSRASFEAHTGKVHVEGTLTLNYVKVRCVADIELETLNGTGHLVALEEVYP
jgi:Core binding factor beta subunit